MEDLQNQDAAREPDRPAAGADVLPADAVEEILRRVPPRGLAACRRVCTSWRAVVDSNRLLRADLLPLSVAGILVGFAALNFTELFHAPSSSPISARLDFLPRPTAPAADDDEDAWTPVRDHCNGLLLLADHVANPATRRWDPLPPPRPQQDAPFLTRYDSRLVHDPTTSPHCYEVVRIPTSSRPSSVQYDNGAGAALEWPPSPFLLQVFSSTTGRWDERPFFRDGGEAAAGTFITKLELDDLSGTRRQSACWRGNLYVHCNTNFFIRISLSTNQYRVIQPPPGVDKRTSSSSLYLGKSAKGIYLASLTNQSSELRVWVLIDDESLDQTTSWVLRHHHNDIGSVRPQRYFCDRNPWKLEDVNFNEAPEDMRSHWAMLARCNSRYDDLTFDRARRRRKCHVTGLRILGFHPFQEVVFLSGEMVTGLAYHLDRSELRELGCLYPACYREIAGKNGDILTSFPYTPCWVRDVPANK
ncbi:hypothetical protein PR202_gb28924 [Eleusine coracana subsp. coracana]|uniref:F-box domain-containing protein n=1 Tax=Eleusine coracana subsp. coracana TaxID=191504 RepID=A0AAV5FY44_ELECO|nr:hypothetical protein QOZ80_8BG0643460 [Eleusine coracana subsp. coracana]GJN39783.1 hypothetical protein PR202_gb28924 [Eleusine coracana subsp. coracana]